MKNYTKFLNLAIVSFISRNTQDNHKDKLQVVAITAYPTVAEDVIIPNLPNKEIKRYIVNLEDLEEFERFYNFVNDLKESYKSYWIYHLKDGNFTVDQENRFRTILNLWTN